MLMSHFPFALKVVPLGDPKWGSVVPIFFIQNLKVAFIYLITHAQYLNSISIFQNLYDIDKSKIILYSLKTYSLN